MIPSDDEMVGSDSETESEEPYGKFPPCFSKERNGGIFLRETKFGRNLTNFLVVLQVVFQKKRACGVVFRNFVFFSFVRSNIAVTDRPESLI